MHIRVGEHPRKRPDRLLQGLQRRPGRALGDQHLRPVQRIDTTVRPALLRPVDTLYPLIQIVQRRIVGPPQQMRIRQFVIDARQLLRIDLPKEPQGLPLVRQPDIALAYIEIELAG